MVFGAVELTFCGKEKHVGDLRAPRQWKFIEEFVRRGGAGESREIKRMVVEHRGSACCSRRFARPVRVRELLDAGKKMGVVIRFDNGLR